MSLETAKAFLKARWTEVLATPLWIKVALVLLVLKIVF